MLMVRKTEGSGHAIFTLSGRIEQKHLLGLKELIQAETDPAGNTIDLKEVKLVDGEVIVFLASCEAVGIKLENCPPYVRMWIDARRNTHHEA
jgi:ABC-type transporter Mla MlaB component